MPHLVIFALLYAVAFASASSKPIDVSINDLARAPRRFEGVRVTMLGYFDAKQHTFASYRESADSIIVDLPEARAKSLKSGEVRVTGTIRCVDLTQPGPDSNQKVSQLKSGQFHGVHAIHIVEVSIFPKGHGGTR